MATTVGTPGAIQTPSPTGGFFGQGVSYPLTLTTTGRLQLSNGTTCVEEALQTILETGTGERPMLPGFGARVGEFEPIDMQRMIAKFKKDVADYEPRVETISSVDIQNGPGVGEVSVSIFYVLVGDANERILTYPIFVGPA
jgi:phage baseplate assembly protein W